MILAAAVVTVGVSLPQVLGAGASGQPTAPWPDDATGDAGTADGAIDDAFGIEPFDDGHAAIARLAPELRAALQQAAHDAAADGIEMRLTGGWRSEGYQQRLFDDAVSEYGSEGEAERFVKRPGTSSHNTGDAIDVGMTDASYWLMEHGSDYGLCQTYANEIWHYELTVAPGEPCPTPAPDAAG